MTVIESVPVREMVLAAAFVPPDGCAVVDTLHGEHDVARVQTLIEIDTCHDLMVSEPERLAQILVERCALYR